jgi:hypothetical protein
MACHGQQAKAVLASQPATASQPRHLRPASKGHGQPAKAAPSQGQGPSEASNDFFFQNDKTITFQTLKVKTVTLGTNTCI